MSIILDRLLWLPKDVVDVSRIKSEMTIYRKLYEGGTSAMSLYEETPSHIGVPRRWGLSAYQEYLKGKEIEDKTTFPFMQWPELKWPVVDGKQFDYKPGQKEAVNTLFESLTAVEPGALLDSPCGSGKTFMALNVAAKLQTSALILVNKNDLAQQWWRTASLGDVDRGIPPFWPGSRYGHVQQNTLIYKNCHYVTAMAQTLRSRIDSLPPDFWTNFGILIGDEGHLYAAESLEFVLRKIPARYRLFVSATWRRKDGCECIWHYHVGIVRSKPRIVRLTGEYVQVPWKTNFTDAFFTKGKYFDKVGMVTAIGENVPYNNWIVEQLVKSSQVGRRMLVVSGRREHCIDLRKKFMHAMINIGKVPDVGLYVGNSKDFKLDDNERKRALRRQNILATYGMMTLGTDVPELDTLILATPMQDVQQVCGRIQRDNDNKKPLLIIDPVFDTPWNRKQAAARVKIYEKLGFRKKDS